MISSVASATSAVLRLWKVQAVITQSIGHRHGRLMRRLGRGAFLYSPLTSKPYEQIEVCAVSVGAAEALVTRSLPRTLSFTMLRMEPDYANCPEPYRRFVFTLLPV